jgi:hypothetical protein
MSSDRETTRIVRSWLDEGVTTLPDRILDQVLDQLPATPQRRPWWQAWRNTFVSNTLKVALTSAAALVIAVIGIGLYFNQPGGVGPPAPSPSPSPSPTAVEIAEAYIAARNAYDPVRAKELVADNFTTSEPDERFRDLASLEGAFELHKAFGFQYSDGDCSQRSATGDRAVVLCDYLWTTEVHRISGQPPTPARFTFFFRDGRISAVYHDASSNFYFGQGSFYDGFLAEHLEYRDLLDDAELYSEEYRATLELLPEYFELYEEWLVDQRGP